MSFPTYRPVTDLTDEEVTEIMQIIYPSLGADEELAAKIVSIDRVDDGFEITCESAWTCDDDDLPEPETQWAQEFFELGECGIKAYDFGLSYEEGTLVQKYLLAKGCNALLKDNPYL